jgi:uncharacterized membrane protein YkoI
MDQFEVMVIMKKIILLIAFSIIIVATAVSASNLESSISPEAAKESVIEFMNNSKIDLHFGNDISLSSGEFYMIGTNSEEFWVNKHSGVVERATFYSEMNKKSNGVIPLENAQDIALFYAKMHYKDFDEKNLQLKYHEFHDTGICNEYIFLWRDFLQNVETPSFVLVTVNANSGNIVEYVGLSRDVYVSLKPTISNNEAIEIASDYFGIPTSDVISIQLKVINFDLMDQRLIWEVVIKGKPVDYTMQGGTIQIDVEEGKILRVFQWL